MTRFFAVLLCVAFLASCEKKSKPQASVDDEKTEAQIAAEQDKNFTHVSGEDPAMKEAIATAKRDSGKFMEALRNPKASFKGFRVKKPYPAEPSKFEHMWIDNLRAVPEGLEGTIANDAYETKAVQYGQKVKLKIDEISDWMYIDGNRLVGGYTIRYFANRMSAAEKKELEEQMGFVIE